jgi:hypothetical protein
VRANEDRLRAPAREARRIARALGVLAVFMTIAAAAAAQEIGVQAYVESETVYMGETFVYQLVVDGADNATPPDVSAFGPDFSAQYLGGQNSSSQSITVINGKMERQVQRRFVMQFNLTPNRKGRLTIPAVPVTVKGQTFTANAVVVGVDTPVETQDFKLRMSLSRSSCYVGEPVLLTVTWYIGRDVEEFTFSMPVLESVDFSIETPEVKIDQSKKYYRIPVGGQEVIAEKGTGTLDGRSYATISFTKALFPKRAGRLEIPQSSVQCAAVSGVARGRDLFDDFFNDNFFGARRGAMKKYVVPSNALSLDVKELPAEGKPANFAGLVGEYKISASASPLDVSVGDPITLKVTLSGPDYLGHVDLPPLGDQTELATYFKIPDERADGKIVGKTKVFTQTIRAKNENVKEIPPIVLSYFDTKKGRYESVSTAPIPIVVHPTKVVTAVDAEGVSSGPMGSPLEGWKEGIAYNYEGPEVLVSQQYGLVSALRSPPWLAALFAPLAAYLALLSVTVARRRREADTEGRASRGAYRRLRRRLEAIAKRDVSGARLCEEVLGAMRNYLGDRFSATGSTLTTDDVVKMLGEKGAPPEAVGAMREVMSSCEAGAYAGDHSPAADRAAFVRRALEAAEGVEKAL